MSPRGRILDWATAIVLAIGIVASIPMLPVIVVGWVVLTVRSPVGRTGMMAAIRSAADRAAPGTLEGFSGTVLFPIVVAGWFLIALVAFGLMIGDGAKAQIDHPDTILALAVFLGLFIGPTFLAYRSMHPEIAREPFSDWLGRGSARVGVPLVTWIACCWLA